MDRSYWQIVYSTNFNDQLLINKFLEYLPSGTILSPPTKLDTL